LPYFKIFPPSLQLASLVKEIQVYHINWNEENGLPKPYITCLANTEQNLYFFLNDQTKAVPSENVEIPIPPVIVTGPKYKPSGLLFGKNHLMIKVCFHPTGTYRLLGINMQQTVNTGLDAASFWGDEVLDVLSKLRTCLSYDLMNATVCSFLESKFDASCRPQEAIDDVAIFMLNPLNMKSQEEWAALACLSLRQFERNFNTRVGISPKMFIRIVRFEYAMKIKNSCPDKSWLDIALECGYTDSSHLLKEFKEFAEFPPSRFYLQPTSGYSEFPTG
jgi:AraC-like DNA-binding protein